MESLAESSKKVNFVDEEVSCVVPLDPIAMELNKLQNQLKEKDLLLGEMQSEIKALKTSEQSKDKAVEKLQSEIKKLDDKLKASQIIVDQKNLEIKTLSNEKSEALAAQYAAESTLRRVYTTQNDTDFLPITTFLAPLEAEIKKYKKENTALVEDKRALERLTKSKEAALVEAESILKSALERALIVEEIQNQNFEIKRQIEICQEENKILEKSYRQKVQEVERLSQTIKELEEAVLAGGAVANTIHDCRRQISQLNNQTYERQFFEPRIGFPRIDPHISPTGRRFLSQESLAARGSILMFHRQEDDSWLKNLLPVSILGRFQESASIGSILTFHRQEDNFLSQESAASVRIDSHISQTGRRSLAQESAASEEKKTLERELARAKVSGNRIAHVVANDWKDESGKLIPVKQWLEERRLLQAEMQRLRDKLAISEKTAKAESQLKDKLKLRFKTLEEGLKQASNISTNSRSYIGSSNPSKPNHTSRSASQPRASVINSSGKKIVEKSVANSTKELKQANGIIRKTVWPSRNKVLDNIGKENAEMKENSTMNVVQGDHSEEIRNIVTSSDSTDDTVSGFLYDRLQKELIILRKTCEAKDNNLSTKEEEIKMLTKKIETLTKAREVEQKKMKREAMTQEKDSIQAKAENKTRNSNSNSAKRSMKTQ